MSLSNQQTSLINVLGDVKSSGRLPATAEGERILDTITRAGGPSGPGPDKWVMLDRKGKRAIAPFGALFFEPANNVYVFPNDTIYLYNDPQTFLTFGALGTQTQFRLVSGASASPRPSPRPMAYPTGRLIPHRSMSIEAKPATLPKPSASTAPNSSGRLFRSSTT